VLDDAKRAKAPKCSRLRSDGQPCRANAVRGTDPLSCRRHAGKSLAKIRAEVAVKETVAAWGLGDTKTDPGELLLRLVSQAAVRAAAYAQELERVVAENNGNLEKALTGETWITVGDGDSVKSGEYIRAIAQLEAAERDRAANFATKAIAAGLAERQVRLAEQQGQLIATVIRNILGDLDLTAAQQARVAEIVPLHLRAVA
jgi:hypothetical protein